MHAMSALHPILRESDSQLLLLEDPACWNRLTPAAEQLARLKRIVTL
jgi:hypothetical protein